MAVAMKTVVLAAAAAQQESDRPTAPPEESVIVWDSTSNGAGEGKKCCPAFADASKGTNNGVRNAPKAVKYEQPPSGPQTTAMGHVRCFAPTTHF